MLDYYFILNTISYSVRFETVMHEAYFPQLLCILELKW